jgi:hypothetical protein
MENVDFTTLALAIYLGGMIWLLFYLFWNLEKMDRGE